MQRQHHYSAGSHLHFITASTYRRVRLFDSPRFRKRFIETLDQLRTEFDFRLVGYVLMPEHFHLLISPSKVHSPSRIVGSLKQRTARHIIENLKRCKEPWCRRMLEKIVLPETVHDESPSPIRSSPLPAQLTLMVGEDFVDLVQAVIV